MSLPDLPNGYKIPNSKKQVKGGVVNLPTPDWNKDSPNQVIVSKVENNDQCVIKITDKERFSDYARSVEKALKKYGCKNFEIDKKNGTITFDHPEHDSNRVPLENLVADLIAQEIYGGREDSIASKVAKIRNEGVDGGYSQLAQNVDEFETEKDSELGQQIKEKAYRGIDTASVHDAASGLLKNAKETSEKQGAETDRLHYAEKTSVAARRQAREGRQGLTSGSGRDVTDRTHVDRFARRDGGKGGKGGR